MLAKLQKLTLHTTFKSLLVHLESAAKAVSLPGIGIIVFIFLWQITASNITTSLGQFPGPADVWKQSKGLVTEHYQEREKAQKFYDRQAVRNEKKLAKDPNAVIKVRQYTGQSTFFDKIITSLYTVAFGFLIATLIAIPLGIVCGLSEKMYRAVNPIIQVFKPVSPLAWLPLVTIVVSATYTSADPYFEKSFVTSAVTVAPCCLWPTVVNTIVGVAGIDRDLVDVSRVLRLPTLVHIKSIVIPSALPSIFTGLRLSLATGWMVLIAAEMLAQNPGLGKFIWDEFQNGSSSSLSRILAAVVTIGMIGFILDHLMLMIQKRFSWDRQAVLR